MRERNRVEEADNDLTEDLFGGSARGKGSSDISSVPLKTMQVRLVFDVICRESAVPKMDRGSADDLLTF